MKPLCLYEPYTSLNLSPFAARAVKGIGVTTIEELSIFVFEKTSECKGMGQSHVEEIREKIILIVGAPPYKDTNVFDIKATLRLVLQNISLLDKAFFILYTGLEKAQSLPVSAVNEAQMLLRKNPKERFTKIVLESIEKHSQTNRALEENLFHAFVLPFLSKHHEIVHREELFAHLYSISSVDNYELFCLLMRILGMLLGEPFLFSRFVENVFQNILCHGVKQTQMIKALIAEAKSYSQSSRTSSADISALLARRFPLPKRQIQNILFWAFLEEDPT